MANSDCCEINEKLIRNGTKGQSTFVKAIDTHRHQSLTYCELACRNHSQEGQNFKTNKGVKKGEMNLF